jgi:DNA polymerase-3 subunit epsilon
MRQIFLDTETTGLEHKLGHRIIEIGCVEMRNRRLTNRHFHRYLNPERDIDAGALAVHGISREFLQDKPRFADIAGRIPRLRARRRTDHPQRAVRHRLSQRRTRPARHGADRHRLPRRATPCAWPRRLHPGKKNNLNALCERYGVDNSHRTLHGALLDAEILWPSLCRDDPWSGKPDHGSASG